MEINFGNISGLLYALSLSFLIVLLLTPTITRIARQKNLVAVPNGRTSHKGMVPSLGGFAIFTGFLISSILFIDLSACLSCKIFMIGAIIIFSIGLKDDILVIDPWKKLIGQIFVSLLIAIIADVRFTNLHGFLGIYEIDYFTSLLLTTFVIIVITNSFNLIDGIDGLAASIGILVVAVFGTWFFIADKKMMTLICAQIIGTYLAFLIFNFSKGKYKIFMGDGGSLLLGYSISFLAIQFNEMNASLMNTSLYLAATPSVTIGILIIPLFDTLRVFIIRLLKGNSPFTADKNHLHHIVLKITKKHYAATAILVTANIFFILLVLNANTLGIFWLTILILFSAMFMLRIFNSLIFRRNNKRIGYLLILRLFLTFFK